MAPLYKRLVFRRKTTKCAVMMGLTTVLSACGGEDGGGSTTTPPPPAPINRAPIVTLSDVPTEIREAEALNFRFSGSDPDGDALTYTLATTAGPDLNLSVSGLNGMGTAPSVDSDMTATIQVTANDGRLSTTATADILIVNNAAPNAALTTDTASVREGATVSLDASSSSDAEDDPLTYSYVVIAGPDIDLTGQTGPMTSFTAPDVDADTVLTIEVSVDDGRDISSETLNITIFNNTAPVASLTATPEAVDEGIDITFDASASTDSENDPLTFSYVQISGPALNLDNAGISFTTSAPEVDVDSVVTLEVQVSDGRDISTQRVDVDIRNIEQMPAFPLTLEIDRTLSIEGELFDINGFLNPSDTGLIAVSDIDGGQVGLRAIEVGSDTEFLPGSIELLTPQFERDLEIMEGEFSSYLVIESNGVTFLQQDTSFRDPVLNISGNLDINGVCASQMTSLSFTSTGGIIIFGRTGGVDLYSYRGAVGVSGEIEFDFDSLTLQDSINDGNNYCALSIPRALEANGRNSSATSFMAFSTEDFDIQRFQIQDNGAGLLSLSPIFRIENSGLDASSQSFVKGLSNINLFNTMAVIVTDGSHNGRHSLQYIHDPINDRIPQPELIRMFTGNWSLGVPTDIALGDLDTSSENYLFAITPDTPQAVAFRFPLASSFLTPPLEPSFLEVGLGASLAFSDPARFGDERDDDFDGLILGYPEKREIRRFAVSDIAD